VPGASDDAVIAAAGTPLIRLSAGNQSVRSVSSDTPVEIDFGATLRVGTVFRSSANITLSGGSLIGGTFETNANAKFIVSSRRGNSVDGISINGEAELVGESPLLNITGGLSLFGQLTLGVGATLNFNAGSQTLGGGGTILMSGGTGPSYPARMILNAPAMTLTISAGITVSNARPVTRLDAEGYLGGQTGTTIINYGSINSAGGSMNSKLHLSQPGATLINYGTLAADQGAFLDIRGVTNNQGSASASDGATLAVDGDWTSSGLIRITKATALLSGAWVSRGRIDAVASSTLSLSGSWNNSGYFTTADSTVDLAGTLSQSQLGTTHFARSIFNISGDWDLGGGTLDVTPYGNIFYLTGGALRNGEVIASLTSATPRAWLRGGSLDHVTVNVATSALAENTYLNVINGLTLNGALSLYRGSNLGFNSVSESIDGTGTINLYPGGSATISVAADSSLTIGSDITISGGGTAQYPVTINASNATIINQGTIRADVGPGTTLFVTSRSFQNAGTLSSLAGSTLNVSGLSGETRSIVIRDPGSVVSLAGNQMLTRDPIELSGGTALKLAGAWTNNAMIRVTGGSTLSIATPTSVWTSTGAIVVADSTLELNGRLIASEFNACHITRSTVVFNASAVTFDAALLLDESMGEFRIHDGIFRAGTITSNGHVRLTFTRPSRGNNIDGMTFDGDSIAFISPDTGLYISGGITINCKLTLAAHTKVSFMGNSTIGGDGTIDFPDNADQGLISTGFLTIGAGITIRVSAAAGNGIPGGIIGDNHSSGGTLLNYGTLLIEGAGQPLSVVATQVWNYGTTRMLNGAKLTVTSGVVFQAGTMDLASGSRLTISGDLWQDRGTAGTSTNIPAGTTVAVAGSVFIFRGTLTVEGTLTCGEYTHSLATLRITLARDGTAGHIAAVRGITIRSGVLDVTANEFDPSYGMPLFTTNLLSGATLSGSFSSYTLAPTAAGKYLLRNTGTGITLLFDFADYNGDGGVDGSDIAPFISAWEQGLPWADINGDGGVDAADLEAFFALWAAGGR
jgi:hypothetical protein